ncbi:heavy metal-associated isoprenylated plant protein 30-like [Rosa rugosa]|uniref:heavy metal-associated isoprenylated plant protein 30-like n=1 Tax=Rosa rugosa TaxID=74645 RepID=UPI002B4130ED|nr:heavy metal-associated isoprenylated plant protein 30-like [Rosa rugosa]
MATSLKRTFGSILSSIAFLCYTNDQHHDQRYHQHHHHKSRSNIHKLKYNMPRGRPLSLQTVELKVRMCCTGCERVVKHAIFKLRGIDSVEVNLPMEKVTVVGYVERNKVLKAVRRAGKRAEFWPYPNPPLYFTSTADYFKDTTNEFKESYNYYRHGYNIGDKHGTIPMTQRGDDKVSNMFNDDNVNACSVM